MTSTSTPRQPRESGTALQHAQNLYQTPLHQTPQRPAARVAVASVWPGSDADPYILQRHAELPVSGTARAMGWPND